MSVNKEIEMVRAMAEGRDPTKIVPPDGMTYRQLREILNTRLTEGQLDMPVIMMGSGDDVLSGPITHIGEMKEAPIMGDGDDDDIVMHPSADDAPGWCDHFDDCSSEGKDYLGQIVMSGWSSDLYHY